MAITLDNFLRLAAVVQFAILSAAALAPTVLKWRENLAHVDAFLRRVFWVYGSFIFMTIVAFGMITLLNSDALVSGTFLARSICGFMAVFWLARLTVQLAVFRSGPALKHWFLKLGYHGLTVAFAYLASVYGVAALH